MEVNEFDLAIKIFNQRGAAFHPVAGVIILHAVNDLHFGAVDVAADHTVGPILPRHNSQGLLVFRDELDGRLGLGLYIRRNGPVTEPQRPPHPIEVEIKVENPIVKVRTHFFQKMVEMRQAIRLVAMDDEIFFAIGPDVDRLASHDDAAKPHADKLLDEFVVIAADVNDLGVLAALAEQLLNEHVIVIAPEPAVLELPAVNKVADDVEVFAIHQAQEIQQLGDAGVARAEVDVRNPNRAADQRLVQIQIQILLVVVHT